MKTITRDEAFTLLKKYNKDPFHIQHALTVEAVMKWYASELGYREAGVGEDVIHSVVSHGYGITVGCGATIDVAPEHEMEKVLFAADELTGLIWAAALMRPSKSTKDMELKSLKDHIWGYEYIGDTRTVDVHIKRLREKIKDNPHWSIATVWGIGYKFEVKNP